MPRFSHHLFVCGNQRSPGNPRGCCDPDGSEQLCNALRAELAKHALPAPVRANKCGCLDQCELGPMLVIYPQGIWYGHVQVNDVPRIVRETILEGKVLTDLLVSDEQLNTRSKGNRA
jgi:(2Fe-2S) ferredoxin